MVDWVVKPATTKLKLLIKPCQSGNPDAEPEAWDWQNEPHNKFGVFTPFQSSDPVNQPSFMKINRNISVTVGETAYLPCRVKNLNDYTVI